MATSANPTLASRLTPHNQVVAHTALKLAQVVAMVVPPGYVAYTLARRGKGAPPLSVSRLMRVTTASVAVGAVVGGGAGYWRVRGESDEVVRGRCERLKSNASQVRSDDYSIIGAFLGALLGPAILLKRAPFPALVLGGASIGLGAGVWTHLIRALTRGEDVKPDAMTAELKSVATDVGLMGRGTK